MEEIEVKTAEIIELKKNVGQNIWQIGNRLNEIKDSEIYLQKYGSWTEFLVEGVDLSERSCLKLMRIAKNFDSPTVADWGYAKLDLMLSIEEPERKELMQNHGPSTPFSKLKESISPVPTVQKAEGNTLYYVETEEQMRGVLDRLCTFEFKSDFKDYSRRPIILQLGSQIHEEVDKHGKA